MTTKDKLAEQDDYRVIELSAENFMRLSAVCIRPGEGMTEITGRNAQGKTSAIKAISWALGGKDFAEDMPLKIGKDRGEVAIDLGALRVTKRLQRMVDETIKTSLSIEFKDGSRPRNAQATLDELRGHLLDPIAFAKATAKKRVEMVKDLFPEFDFAAHERMRKEIFDERTDNNRVAKRAAAARDAVALLHSTRPAARLDAVSIEHEFAEAKASNETTEKRRLNREQTTQQADALRETAERLRNEARAADKQAAELETLLANAAPLPELIDTAEIAQRMSQIQTVNDIISRFEERDRLHVEYIEADNRSKFLTLEIEHMDKLKQTAIAGAKLPYPGLAFTEDDVTLNGVPFGQASFSEQLRASVAVAMSLEPKLKVMLVREYGSLLDDDNMKLLREIVVEHGWQMIIETVGAVGGPGKVLIEDGRVMP